MCSYFSNLWNFFLYDRVLLIRNSVIMLILFAGISWSRWVWCTSRPTSTPVATSCAIWSRCVAGFNTRSEACSYATICFNAPGNDQVQLVLLIDQLELALVFIIIHSITFLFVQEYPAGRSIRWRRSSQRRLLRGRHGKHPNLTIQMCYYLN